MKANHCVRNALCLAMAIGALATIPVVSHAQGDGAAAAPAAGGQRAQRRGAVGGGIELEHSYPQIESGKWTGKRLADGQPDISGDWSNTIANHNNTTDPQGGIPGDPAAQNRQLGLRSERAPSRITDPADGQLPYQPWARAIQQKLQAAFFSAKDPEDIEPLDRCAPAGIPKSLYWHGYEVRQYPGKILFLFQSGWRIIYLDDASHHLPANIKLWNGDSRGHWEGNTLVVDVSNLNSKARFGRTQEFTTDQVHVVERYIFSNDGKRFNYVATFTDPSAFTRPFTVTVPARRWTLADPKNGWHFPLKPAHLSDGDHRVIPDYYEFMCIENNGGFGQQVAIGAAPVAASQTH
jgi:hypothetical protein